MVPGATGGTVNFITKKAQIGGSRVTVNTALRAFTANVGKSIAPEASVSVSGKKPDGVDYVFVGTGRGGVRYEHFDLKVDSFVRPAAYAAISPVFAFVLPPLNFAGSMISGKIANALGYGTLFRLAAVLSLIAVIAITKILSGSERTAAGLRYGGG